MFPRRSAVMRVGFCLSLALFVIFMWVVSPGDSWHSLFRVELNETQLRIEYQSLRAKLNYTQDKSLENKTVDEIYQYVQDLRRQLPVNPHNFHYIINPTTVCKNIDVFIITYIHSAPEHYKRRTAIRETWGDQRNFDDFNFRLVFLVGKPKDQTMQDALYMESDMYGDIVQENFLDTYRNLTYKGILGLKWVTKYCSHAKFILKTDDDIFVNIFNVASHLQSIRRREGDVKKLLLCLVWYRMKVIRDPRSKWYLSPQEFAGDYFPTYCSGSAFMMTTDLAADMYKASLDTPFFWVDDFYITGLLAKKAGVTHRKFNSVYTLGSKTFLERFTDESKWRTWTFGHVHNLNHMVQVWKRVFKDRKQSMAIADAVVANQTGIAKYIH